MLVWLYIFVTAQHCLSLTNTNPVLTLINLIYTVYHCRPSVLEVFLYIHLCINIMYMYVNYYRCYLDIISQLLHYYFLQNILQYDL